MHDSRAFRYAVGYAPPDDSPWWEAGSQWLGRCATSGRTMQQPHVDGFFSNEFAHITSTPRTTGWQASLKAPFVLASRFKVEDLHAEVSALAQSLLSFEMPRLAVSRLDDFLALVPVHHAQAIDSVASRCVKHLHPLAEPITDSALALSKQADLTPYQDELLRRWGSPHVMQYYRFHVPLTGSLATLNQGQVDKLQAAAQKHFAWMPPPRLDSLALFAEATRGGNFGLVARFPLK